MQTREQAGVEVVGASCELSNDVGKWFVTTPGSVSIHKSNKDLQVSCKKSGFEPGRAAVVSDTKAAMFGNIILGGGIGAIIDHNSGAAYEYPTVIEIFMGSFSIIKTPNKQTSQQDIPHPVQTNTAPQQAIAPENSLMPKSVSGPEQSDRDLSTSNALATVTVQNDRDATKEGMFTVINFQKVDHEKNWIKIGRNEILALTAYAATKAEALTKNRDKVVMWRMHDYRDTQEASGYKFSSAKLQNEYSCKNEQIRFLTNTTFSGNMGEGDAIFSVAGTGKWQSIIHNSIDEAMWKFACGKK